VPGDRGSLIPTSGRTTIDFDDLQQLTTPYSIRKSTPQTVLVRVLVTQGLADHLEGSGVVVNAVYPGARTSSCGAAPRVVVRASEGVG
jgi:hypothetical protein